MRAFRIFCSRKNRLPFRAFYSVSRAFSRRFFSGLRLRFFSGLRLRFFSGLRLRFFSGVCSDGFASEACRIRFLILAASSAAFFETCPALRSCRFSFLAFLTRVPPGRFRRVPGGTLNVLKRRRAALPHPAECSTIAVPGLSFQVRNGCWAFPPGCDRRKS